MVMVHTSRHAALKTDINEHLAFLHDLAVGLRAKTVLELGVRGGESTVALLEAVHETAGRVISVDVAPCGEARKRMEDYGLAGRWTFVQSDDIAFGRSWDRSQTVDLVFVDTSHVETHTKAELEVFTPLLRPGGAMAFHDTVSFYKGVLQPILDFVARNPAWKFENRWHCNGLGVLRKPAT